MTEPLHDDSEIATSLRRAAEAVPVGDATDLRRDVERVASRRRRRRAAAVAASFAVVTLTAGVGIVSVMRGDDTSDRIQSAPVTDPPTERATSTTVAPAESAPRPAPVATTPSSPDPATGGGVSQIVVDAGSTVEPGAGAELFAWNDGFLAIRRTTQPLPLPTRLPEEVAAEFPQEVLDLFPDGLPPTIDQAAAILRDAGLYDVVAEIVLDNPDVNDAIYTQQPEMVVSARFSLDGVEWSDVDATFPNLESGYPLHQAAFGEWFALVTQPAWDGLDAGAYVDLHVSNDLVDWETHRLDLPEGSTAPGVRFSSSVQSFAAGPDGWMAIVSQWADLDLVELLPDDLELDFDLDGVGYGYDDSGVHVQQYVDDEVGDEMTFTWEELGFDEPPVSDEQIPTGFAAAWSGPATQIEIPSSIHSVHRFGGGFVQIGDTARVSRDGIEWTEVAMPIEGWASWVLDIGDGLIVATGARDGLVLHVLDLETLAWAPFDLADLPAQAQPEVPVGGRAVVLADYGDWGYIEPATVRISGETDGFSIELTITMATGAATYEVRDADAAVVASESVDAFDGPDAFAHVSEVGGDLEVRDPATGDVVAAFSESSIVYESLDENGGPMPEPDVDAQPPMPEYWVVAATDGELLVEAIDVETEWVSGVAVQGDTVLVAVGDGSFVKFTGG